MLLLLLTKIIVSFQKGGALFYLVTGIFVLRHGSSIYCQACLVPTPSETLYSVSDYDLLLSFSFCYYVIVIFTSWICSDCGCQRIQCSN